jgi:Leucine-rich repeat (LRR) protein
MVGKGLGHLLNLHNLKLEDCELDYRELVHLPLKTLTLRRQHLSKLPVLDQVESLHISNCAIDSFELFPNLKKLTLKSITSRYDIEIEEIDPLDYAHYNQTYIPLVHLGPLSHLEELQVQEAKISGDLNAPLLRKLEFEHVHIQNSLSLEECFSLVSIRLMSCVGIGAASLRLDCISSLTDLHIGVSVPISFTNITFPSSLTSLKIELRHSRAMDSFNSMQVLQTVPQMKSLRKLQFSEWRWVNLDCLASVSSPLSIKTLIADGNGLSNIQRLDVFSQLVVLNLDWNAIEDIAPISNFLALKDLSLSHNRIKDVTPLAECVKIERLVLSFNYIQDLRPLRKLPCLHTLESTSNPVQFR